MGWKGQESRVTFKKCLVGAAYELSAEELGQYLDGYNSLEVRVI